MKKIIFMLVVLVLIFKINLLKAEESFWQEISQGQLNVKAVLVDKDNPDLIYFGSDKGIFKSEDGGRSWRNVFSASGKSRMINFLLFDPKDKNIIYVATENGLFFSNNAAKDWRRIFKGKDELENRCISLAVFSSVIYLGTEGGLFVSKDKGLSWIKEKGILGKEKILALATSKDKTIYVVSSSGVFKMDIGGNWERIFVAYSNQNDNHSEEEPESENKEEKESSYIRHIYVDPEDANFIYLASSLGVYRSQDKGKSWHLLSDYGLLRKATEFVFVSSQRTLYALNSSGIFEFKDGRWYELSLDLPAQELFFLTEDKENRLYVAGRNGLFKKEIKDSQKENSLELYIQGEPTIQEVQEVAIKYAEVEPEKIKCWRKQARLKALLPKLSIGLDRDRNKTTSSSIWGTYGSNSSPGKYFVGPDDITKYNNKNWSVELSWELGDLIYSDDQTSIDVRSRLMVQLRDDILDEVTKTYFERLRIKIELDNLSLTERKKRFEKELRLQELTATLDALTGGYFSKQLKNNSS